MPIMESLEVIKTTQRTDIFQVKQLLVVTILYRAEHTSNLCTSCCLAILDFKSTILGRRNLEQKARTFSTKKN